MTNQGSHLSSSSKQSICTAWQIPHEKVTLVTNQKLVGWR